MKFISWNVNGIRAWYKKGSFNWVLKQEPDFFCVQETKAQIDQLNEELSKPKGYFSYFNSSKEKKGHSGTAIYTKMKPKSVTYGLGKRKFDNQGRQINLFYKDFVLINCYFPNGGGPTDRLIFKLEYYKEFLKFINKIDSSGKKVIFCGDINAAHEEIDLARSKENYNQVGFLPEERSCLDDFFENGYVDTYRNLYPNKIQYSWWDMKTRARERNVGWRIDYFFVSKSLKNNILKAGIVDKVFGSDHAPIFLEIDL